MTNNNGENPPSRGSQAVGVRAQINGRTPMDVACGGVKEVLRRFGAEGVVVGLEQDSEQDEGESESSDN